MPTPPVYRTSAAPPRPADAYAAGWATYRRNRTRQWLLFFSWPLVAGGVISLVHLAGGDDDTALMVMGGSVFLPTFVLLNVLFYGQRCPRCARTVHARMLVHDPWSRKCMNCGLRVGELKGDAS